MLSLTVPYKAGHHTLGRVCVGEGLGSEEGYFMGRRVLVGSRAITTPHHLTTVQLTRVAGGEAAFAQCGVVCGFCEL